MKFPHPLALLIGCIALAAALTWVLPAGEYERRADPATGRSVVVDGSYHRVDPAPVSAFRAVVAIPRGMLDAGQVIFLILLAGGAFTVVDKTGALRWAMDALARALRSKEAAAIPVMAVFFALGGALENMGEEIIALVPMLLLLTRRLGFDALVAVAMSLGSAVVGAAFSPVNPFQVLIAQSIAGLPPASGMPLRIVFGAIALGIWIAGCLRFAARHRTPPSDAAADVMAAPGLGARGALILALIPLALGMFVFGLLRYGWYLDELSALLFLMGVAAGLLGRLGVRATAEAFAEGFAGIAYAGALVGFARAISLVLADGKVIDTIVHGMFVPVSRMPDFAAAVGIMGIQSAIHVAVPSVSGQAVLTMPVLAPLADLMGMSRQVAVLAYQYGAGLCDMITPTNGVLMAVLAAGGVSYGRWLRFAVPLFLLLLALGAVAMAVAMALGTG